MSPLRWIVTGLALLAAAAQASEVPAPGRAVFDARCAACHNAGGQGTAGIAPALAGTLPHLGSEDGRRYLSQVLVHGLSGRIVSQGQVFTGAMPAQAAIPDEELAAVANYLAQELNGGTAPLFAAEDFAQARTLKPTHKALRELRERLPR